jgi:Plasmid pRiA4b ORF-3-like protein
MATSKRPPASGSICQLKVTLRDVAPPIWRRLLVRNTTSLATLHAIIQEAMGWQNYHLWEFVVGSGHYEAPDPEATGRDATKVKLKDLPLAVGRSFDYVYDPGDDWQHEIVLEDRLPADSDRFYPACTGGARACPPEDSGGVGQYAEILRIMQSAEDPEFRQTMEWLGEGFHPEVFDLRATNRILMLAFGHGAV